MIETRKIKEITPYDKNPRKNDKAISHVLESLNRHGQVKPIVLSAKGKPFGQEVICAGHTTFEALKRFGAKEVKVVVKEFADEAQFVDYNIRDNKTSEFAEWDEVILDELSSQFDIDLRAMDFDFTGNLDDDHLLDGLTDPDDVPDVPDEPTAKLGQIWKLGKHRLMCGDSTDKEQVEKLMDGEKADVLHTDPPYGMRLDCDYSKMPRGGKKYSNVIGDHEDFNAGFLMEFDIDKKYIWGCDWFYESLEKGFSPIVWDKQPYHCEAGPQNHFELCWAFPKEKRRIIRKLWTGFTAKEKGEDRVHPTQKPNEVIESILEKVGTGKTVLDLFGGSGSTLIACEKTNRKCRMMELDNRYVDVIIQRWCDFTGIYNIECDGKPYEWKSKK